MTPFIEATRASAVPKSVVSVMMGRGKDFSKWDEIWFRTLTSKSLAKTNARINAPSEGGFLF